MKREIEQFLKESLIEGEIINFLVINNIPINLREDINFLSLVMDKLYMENLIFNLKVEIDADFSDGSSPDENSIFYSLSKEERQRAIDYYNNKIDKKKEEYANALNDLEYLNNQLNFMIKAFSE